MNADATPKTARPAGGKQVIWINVVTVISAAILIGAEVFGAAFAGSWAIANLFGFDETVRRVLDVAFLALGAYIMFRFIQFARTVEPFSR
ncbi:hypothetical protein [Pseudorhodoplanes sp.]|uniref:hypothetical protein n=1 Tax=Pseudorhodoplanes sp. TaxID=1934341 RepID=UPI00391CBDB2